MGDSKKNLIFDPYIFMQNQATIPTPARTFSGDFYKKRTGLYIFGFNGQEKDDEIYGSTGSSYTAQFWQYDSRTGRRWNLDPKPDPSVSYYATFAGNPIWFIDILGNKWKKTKGENSDKAQAEELINSSKQKREQYKQKAAKYWDEFTKAVEHSGKNGDESESVQKAFSKYHEAQAGVEAMDRLITGLTRMGNDELITYTFNDLGQASQKGARTLLEWSGTGWGNNDPNQEKLITINYFSKTANGYSTSGGKAHESIHAYDVLLKNILPATKYGDPTLFFMNVYKSETKAYKTQFFFDKKSMPKPYMIKTSIDITKDYLRCLGYKIK